MRRDALGRSMEMLLDSCRALELYSGKGGLSLALNDEGVPCNAVDAYSSGAYVPAFDIDIAENLALTIEAVRNKRVSTFTLGYRVLRGGS